MSPKLPTIPAAAIHCPRDQPCHGGLKSISSMMPVTASAHASTRTAVRVRSSIASGVVAGTRHEQLVPILSRTQPLALGDPRALSAFLGRRALTSYEMRIHSSSVNEFDDLLPPWRDLESGRGVGLLVGVGVVAGFIAATVSVFLDVRLLLTMFPAMILAFLVTTVVLLRRRRQAP